MATGFLNRGGWIAIGILAGSFLVMLLSWEGQAYRMRGEFINALRNGTVETLPPDLHGKTWSEDEIGTLRVMKVPQSAGQEQALLRVAHARGEPVMVGQAYGYQSMITDLSTGIRHVFGRVRGKDGVWRWSGIHPDSAAVHIQRRQEELDALKRQR